MTTKPKGTVLLVEDDKFIRRDLALLLASTGYHVQQAENGWEAIQLMKALVALPSVIVLDIMMPVMDGWQFRAEQLKDPRLAQIPVVVLTADGRASQKAAKMSAQGFAQKPVDIDVFLNEIAKFAS